MIGTAKQNGSSVSVYDEKGNYLFSKSGTLIGYTATTVTIKTSSGSQSTYDEKGSYLFSK